MVYKKWDDGKIESEVCCKCSEEKPVEFKDYFTNEGCMELWLEIQKKDWIEYFIHTDRNILDTIHPDRLATAVYEFLNELK